MDELIRKPYREQAIYDCLTRRLGVTYVYEDVSASPVAQPSATLQPKALASLPETLRGALGDALATLNAARISAVVRRIAELDPPLGEALAQYVSQLNYSAILKALKAGADDDASKQ